MRIGLVLSAGGLRGAAHVGVLRALVRHAVPIDVIVGVSAGAIIAAYYAAVGLDVEELIGDARAFRGRHLFAYSLHLHLRHRLAALLEPWCGVIPGRLRQLEDAGFDRLRHGVLGIGVVCYDRRARRARYFATGLDHGARLCDVARASAAIPILFPPHAMVCEREDWRLTDGGVTDPVPVAFARQPPLEATHLIVSDCRWYAPRAERRYPREALAARNGNIVWVRPRMPRAGTLWSPRHGLLSAVAEGEAAVTSEVLAHVRGWLDRDAA